MQRFLWVLLVPMISLVRPCRADPAPEVPAPVQAPEVPAPVQAPEVPAPGVPAPEMYTLTLGDIVRANLERSYVAFPIGIAGLEPLIFEADLVPNFSVLPRSWHVALFLTPKIILRMFAAKSAPVSTPSYMPRLTTFFWFDDSANGPTAYFSAAFLHHSNGQSGAFYNEDGSHNHKAGSFGTNYFEFAAYPNVWKSPSSGWNSIVLEWHPRVLENEELRSTYGNLRLRLGTTIYSKLGGYASDLSVGVTAILSEMQKPTNANTFFARFPISVKYAVRPPAIDVGLYAAYYQGQDYYNIWYDRFISVLEIGISADLNTGIVQHR
ncbi:MAG TPA: hypothetical protein VER12_16200 [Polyangiaceae bacterium]|nr:hypothetical protein [Polyangiaceae bacterium]